MLACTVPLQPGLNRHRRRGSARLEAHLSLTAMCQAALDRCAVACLPLTRDGACGLGDPAAAASDWGSVERVLEIESATVKTGES